ncbi:MAG: single-stranded-DNA-specific exonuclease RecJ [Alphaproteobacteria bacterium]
MNEAAFLGVERSAAGKRWILRPIDERLALALSQRLDLPEVIGRIMAGRGISLEGAATYLEPTLKQLLPDPSTLTDMDAAAMRMADAIINGEKVAVFGDYDVDGATSSALLMHFFAAVGAPLRIYIPDRFNEGYGPNVSALLQLKQEGCAVVITVDCGITAYAPLEAARDAGLDVIVVDHHMAEPQLPQAFAIVNPNRLDDESGVGHLAAVGVAFLLIVAVNRVLRQRGFYNTSRPEPDLRHWLDLVALGTICDMVPLIGVNRALVNQGLKVMAQRGNIGLAALADVAGLEARPDAYHAGFLLGPRVNAGGRVGAANLGALLLSCTNELEARRLAEKLDGYNHERRRLESAAVAEAMAEAEAATGDFLLLARDNWHAGIIGIVASRVVDRFNRPTCVVALKDGIGKGSGRSVRGVDLGAALIAARQKGLLINGGGHPMAGGFTVEEAKIPALRAFLAERIAAKIHADKIVPMLEFDAAIQPGGATVDMVKNLERLAPFGIGNPAPRFVLHSVRLVRIDPVGDGHLRCIVAGEGKRSGDLKAIAFRSADGPIGKAIVGARGGVPMHLAGKLQIDTWQGRESVQMVIEDVAAAWGQAAAVAS